jgi:ketosteroid isomerase-like protein
MKSLYISITFILGTSIAFAQDTAQDSSLLDELTATLSNDKRSLVQDEKEIQAFVREYVEVFNARASSTLAEDIFMTPAQVVTHALLTTVEIKDLFDQIYAGIEPNWDHSIINKVDVCLAGPGLAFADLNYSRLDATGNPIQPLERASLLIIREIAGQWRIAGVHPHDAAKGVTCENEPRGDD